MTGPFLNINSKQLKEEVSDIQNKTSEKAFKVVAPYERGISYELCAGTVGSHTTNFTDIAAKAEMLVADKFGYRVSKDSFQKIYQSNHVGHSGERSNVLYVQVEDKDKIPQNEVGENSKKSEKTGDFFDFHYLPRSEAQAFVMCDNYVKNSKVIASILWYFCKFE